MFKVGLSVLLLLLGLQAAAGNTDSSTRVPIQTITYAGLDSLIRTNEYTALYLWPNWCSASRIYVPPILDFMREKKNIAFVMLNDADSRSYVSSKLTGNPGYVKAIYRLQRFGKKNFITINDHRQFKYFYWYYTRNTDREQLKQNQFFMLFNKSGKLLYHNRPSFTADTLRADLVNY